jgi:proline iminopeptidase
MIYGRLDLDTPLVTAWELAQVGPDGELVIVHNADYTPTDPGMGEALIAATNWFAQVCS